MSETIVELTSIQQAFIYSMEYGMIIIGFVCMVSSPLISISNSNIVTNRHLIRYEFEFNFNTKFSLSFSSCFACYAFKSSKLRNKRPWSYVQLIGIKIICSVTLLPNKWINLLWVFSRSLRSVRLTAQDFEVSDFKAHITAPTSRPFWTETHTVWPYFA